MKKSDFGSIIFVLGLFWVAPLICLAAKNSVKQIVSQEKYIDKYYQVDNRGNKKINIYLGDERLATIDITASGQASLNFPLADHLGSPTIITDESGQVASINDYKSFGGLLSSASDPYKFIGKELDRETSLLYFGQRYYDSLLGRFASVDPMLLSGQLGKFLANPQALNTYSYALNNPIVLFDLFGLSTATTNPIPDGGWQLGDPMGQFNGVTAYYNGIGSLDTAHSCVEYAKRYLSQTKGLDLGRVYNPIYMWDHTANINANIKSSSYTLIKYVNGQGFSLPKEGDMLIWTQGDNGHVMVVTESNFDNNAGRGYVEVIDQNAQNKAVSRYAVDKAISGYLIMKDKNTPMAGWLSPVNRNNVSQGGNNSQDIVAPQRTFFQRVWQNTKQFFNKIF